MDETLRQIQVQMLKAHLAASPLDLEEWVERYPEFAEEIRAYLTKLDNALDVEALLPRRAHDEAAAKQRSLMIARAAIQRGMIREKERDLGTRLEKAREGLVSRGQQARTAWVGKHIVYAWIVLLLYESNGYAKRLRAQKVAYLLEHALRPQLFQEHEPNVNGPYDFELRYKAEPRAKAKGWFTVTEAASQRTGWYQPGEKSAAVEGLAREYLADPNLAREFIRYLAQLSNNELEAWTTVCDLAYRLQMAGAIVTPAAVRRLLEQDEMYKEKKSEPYVSEGAIAEALWHLSNLRLLKNVSKIDE